MQGRCMTGALRARLRLAVERHLESSFTFSAAIAWLLAFILIALWSTVFLVSRSEFSVAEARARSDLSNLALAFEGHTLRTVERADQVLRFVRREARRLGPALDLSEFDLKNGVIGDGYHQISVIGADGVLTHSTQQMKPLDLSDRAHFKVHAGRPDDRLDVSQPVLGRLSQKLSIQITRRVGDPEGRFAGVVVVSLDPGFFTQFFANMNLGEEAVVTLVGTDGVVRARKSHTQEEGGQTVLRSDLFREMRAQGTGTVWARSLVDGKSRLWAFRTLPDYDLVAGVGAGESYVLDGARRQTWTYIGRASLLTAVLVLFALVLMRRARKKTKLVAELRRSGEVVSAVNEATRRILFSVSHELRNPLHGILGYAELIRDDTKDPQVREHANVIRACGERLYTLISSMIDLSQLESGRLLPRFAEVNLPALLSEEQKKVIPAAHAKGLGVELSLAPQCPTSILTDQARLRRILSCLLDNAVKFTALGGVRIDVAANDGEVRITISDTGSGISADRIASLFDRFHGTSTEPALAEQGAGLGLPLAKGLTDLIGGALTVDSSVGKGTCVVVSLPLLSPDSAPAPLS